MNTCQISTTEALYDKALSLRYELFFKDCNLSKEVLFDKLESNAIHVATSDESKLIAYARLSDLGGGGFKISQVVVDPQFQGLGYGKGILSFTIGLAKKEGAKEIQLNSRASAIGLYKELGFYEVGERYPSKTTNVPHVKMMLEIST